MKSGRTSRSTLCAAACNDQEHKLLTATPNIQKISICLLLAISVQEKLKVHIRDATKAFVMSRTVLRRPFDMPTSKDRGLEKRKVIRVLLPVYGMPESPIHWIKAYIDNHEQIRTMIPATTDPCLIYRRGKAEIDPVIVIRVDDTICASGKYFAGEDKITSKEFPKKRTVETNESRCNSMKWS